MEFGTNFPCPMLQPMSRCWWLKLQKLSPIQLGYFSHPSPLDALPLSSLTWITLSCCSFVHCMATGMILTTDPPTAFLHAKTLITLLKSWLTRPNLISFAFASSSAWNSHSFPQIFTCLASSFHYKSSSNFTYSERTSVVSQPKVVHIYPFILLKFSLQYLLSEIIIYLYQIII